MRAITSTEPIRVIVVDGSIMLDVRGQMMRFEPTMVQIQSEFMMVVRATISGTLDLGDRVDA